jgi:hypothetical protein
MRCLVAPCFGLALLVAVCGCRSCDRVESELRGRENEVRQLREELDRTSIYNQSLQQELHSLRGELGVGPDGHTPAAYPVQSVALGRQTGGRSNTDCPGDDALQVQLEPKDPEGQSIKAPGQLLVLVQEITPEGIKRPLSSWAIPPEQMRRSWRSGLLTTGYVVNLPWKVWPSTEKLRVIAQFQLTDGRVFEADKDITVRLTPVNKRPASVPDAKSTPSTPTTPPKTPSGREEGPILLPAPQRIEPSKPSTPPPADATPGPFLGAARAKTPLNDWQQVEPPLAPPATEILRPVPLKPGS